MKSDQERVSKLLTDTVTLLCKNGLVYSQEIKVQGLLGITLDKNEVFLVHINELIGGHAGMPGHDKSPAMASSESSAWKKTAAASASPKVVDLTRVADTPRPPPVQLAVNQPLPTGQMASVRKNRPGKQPAIPATVMVPQQQIPARMQHGPPHPRMSTAALQQSPMASRFASNYLAQLRQQVARGMSPGRVMPPARLRPAKQRVQACSTDDDDEDVVIVGTGHEEPSPGWSSPMRKRPLPSHMSSSPAPPQKRPSFQTPPKPPVAQMPPPSVIEQLASVADITGTLELTADDIPTSIEDMIMKISPPAHKAPNTKPAMPPEVCTVTVATADQVETSLLPTEDCVIMTEPAQILPDALVSAADAAATNDGGIEPATTAVENTGQTVAEAPLHPFVYTDIACDVDEVGRADAAMTADAPGFDVLTFDASQVPVDETTEWSCRSWWRCQVDGCLATCLDASELANHYSVVHTSGLVQPTVIVPTSVDPESDSLSSTDSATQENTADDWPGIPCPFAGCGQCIASYPGLVMHHRHVHRVPLPAKQRRAIAMVYRARRLDADRVSADRESGVAHTSSAAVVVSNSFVCPFTGCGVSCTSREDLIAHVHLCHEASDVIQPVCKQETDDTAK